MTHKTLNLHVPTLTRVEGEGAMHVVVRDIEGDGFEDLLALAAALGDERVERLGAVLEGVAPSVEVVEVESVEGHGLHVPEGDGAHLPVPAAPLVLVGDPEVPAAPPSASPRVLAQPRPVRRRSWFRT